MVRSRWVARVGYVLALLVPVLAFAQEPSRMVLTGEIVVKSDDHDVLVAVDEVDSEGQTDGWVDHLFIYLSVRPIIHPITLRDFSGYVEAGPKSLRVLSDSEQRELEFLISRTPPAPRAKDSTYAYEKFDESLHLYHYSGPIVGTLRLSDVARLSSADLSPAALLAGLREKSVAEIVEGPMEDETTGPFVESPDPGGSGSCTSLCSSSGCTAGTCSVSCNPGFCADCECLGEVPPTYPSCHCRLK